MWVYCDTSFLLGFLTFDLWRLASAWSLSAGVFLTFHRRHEKLARVMGMKA